MSKRCDQCASVRITVGRVSRVCHELDSIATLDRLDIEGAIDCLRARAERIGIREITPLQHALARVADALAEHLIDRHD